MTSAMCAHSPLTETPQIVIVVELDLLEPRGIRPVGPNCRKVPSRSPPLRISVLNPAPPGCADQAGLRPAACRSAFGVKPDHICSSLALPVVTRNRRWGMEDPHGGEGAWPCANVAPKADGGASEGSKPHVRPNCPATPLAIPNEVIDMRRRMCMAFVGAVILTLAALPGSA